MTFGHEDSAHFVRTFTGCNWHDASTFQLLPNRHGTARVQIHTNSHEVNTVRICDVESVDGSCPRNMSHEKLLCCEQPEKETQLSMIPRRCSAASLEVTPRTSYERGEKQQQQRHETTQQSHITTEQASTQKTSTTMQILETTSHARERVCGMCVEEETGRRDNCPRNDGRWGRGNGVEHSKKHTRNSTRNLLKRQTRTTPTSARDGPCQRKKTTASPLLPDERRWNTPRRFFSKLSCDTEIHKHRRNCPPKMSPFFVCKRSQATFRGIDRYLVVRT